MTSSLQQRWSASLMNTYGTPPIALVQGKGAKVYDAEGKEYIDMLAGIAVNSLGHAHPAVIEAVQAQVSTLGHVSNLFASQPVIEVAEQLRQRFAPGREDVKAFFCNSGTEANEAALKIAKLSGKRRVLAAQHGFHGRTLGALSITGQPAKQRPFRPLLPDVEFYPYGDIEVLRSMVATDPDDVAAIFLEPIQGETGVIPAPPGFLEDVRALCDAHGIFMIVDEVQTGAGRTGDFFAFAHANVLPDVVTMAKGLGAGLPIGAVLAQGKAAELMQPGAHGTTFGGNPVACAAASAVLDVLDAEFLNQVKAKGEYLATEIEQLPGVSFVRGRGLMLGVVLDAAIAKQVVAEGLRQGLILNNPADNVIRLTPPLVISDEEIAEAITRLAKAISAAQGE
ncbi:acetylornithine transaminase [Corynebacterium pseudopelargi]|uniref:Acetylornithine aminotransferase n=1 Tax=Corynebacterium pseudopelargi TaxID=2080757 RepID=A0A3G6IUT6_9CORY|nr:acetylornithine transaminase [Corynebacterium pseudopelargi]AZA09366.1 Acetylornithine aminotransferase [Corynebacterium pseudopelargi]